MEDFSQVTLLLSGYFVLNAVIGVLLANCMMAHHQLQRVNLFNRALLVLLVLMAGLPLVLGAMAFTALQKIAESLATDTQPTPMYPSRRSWH